MVRHPGLTQRNNGSERRQWKGRGRKLGRILETCEVARMCLQVSCRVRLIDRRQCHLQCYVGSRRLVWRITKPLPEHAAHSSLIVLETMIASHHFRILSGSSRGANKPNRRIAYQNRCRLESARNPRENLGVPRPEGGDFARDLGSINYVTKHSSALWRETPRFGRRNRARQRLLLR